MCTLQNVRAQNCVINILEARLQSVYHAVLHRRVRRERESEAFEWHAPPKHSRWCGGIGRRKGLKIPRGQPRAGSSPATSSET